MMLLLERAYCCPALKEHGVATDVDCLHVWIRGSGGLGLGGTCVDHVHGRLAVIHLAAHAHLLCKHPVCQLKTERCWCW